MPISLIVIFVAKLAKLQWLNENMENIERGIPIPFITHRRISEGYEKVKENSYTYIQKIPVDNDNKNDRIIP